MRSRPIEIGGGDVRAWIEQEAVHLVAASRSGDPVELTRSEVVQLAEALLDLSEELDS